MRRLAEIMGLADPLVSHHLKILAAAGLIERRRSGKFVEYRAVTDGPRGRWLAQSLAGLEPDDLTRQPASAPRVEASPALRKSDAERFERAIGECAARALGSELRGASLCVESERLEPIRTLMSSGARRGLLVASDHIAAARLRRELRGVADAAFDVVTRRNVDPADKFEVVVHDRTSAATRPALADDLRAAVARLEHDGRCLVLVAYDELDDDPAAGHPLIRLRRIISAAGLRCDQIQPIEAQGRHVLAALATRISTAQRVA